VDKAFVSLTQRKSECGKLIRSDRPAIDNAALEFLSCTNCLWMQEKSRVCDYRIHIFELEQLVRHNYPYYYDEFDDRILRIPGAKFCHLVAHVYLQTSNLASFTIEIAIKFWNLMSKMNEMKSHVVT